MLHVAPKCAFLHVFEAEVVELPGRSGDQGKGREAWALPLLSGGPSGGVLLVDEV